MSARVRVRFADEHEAKRWGDRLFAIDPTALDSSAYPYITEDEDHARMYAKLGPKARLFIVPVDSHVRVYRGSRRLGIYCGHSRSIERPGASWDSQPAFEVRYADGYAEVYCPHSQEWEPVG